MSPEGKRLFLQGFAKIAKSEKCPRMSIKLLVYFLCTSGFFYQTWAFLQMYLAYPTALDTSEEYPDTFIGPAITICNRNRILRQPYCKAYPEECMWEHNTWESFCDSYERMCIIIKPPDFNFGIPIFKYPEQQNRSNAFLNALGPQAYTNLIVGCAEYYHRLPCNTTATVIQVPKSGFPYRCFSLFSLLLKPYEEPFNLTLVDGYMVVLFPQPEEYFNIIDSVEVMVVFHDPRKAVNPMTEGIPLAAGKQHNLYPTMERRESLPPPYSSNCMDYLKEWKKNGGSGPLSRDDCIEQCQIEAMFDEYGCVGTTITYPNKFPICEKGGNYSSSEVSRRCASSCRDACEENIYHFTSDAVADFALVCNTTDEYCKFLGNLMMGMPFPEDPMKCLDNTNEGMLINISFDRMKIKKLKQIPRIESIELFSYIGGYLGMWLGISLAAVFDLGEVIYDVIYKAFLKRKRNKKNDNHD